MVSVSVVEWKIAAAAHQRLADGERVGQIAVVRDGEPAELEIGEQRLDVAQHRLAGRRVADMTDRDRARQAADDSLRAEVVADQAHRLVGMEMLAVEGDDAAGFLAAMLKGVQPERRGRAGIGMTEDAEHAAFVMEVIVVGERWRPGLVAAGLLGRLAGVSGHYRSAVPSPAAHPRCSPSAGACRPAAESSGLAS